jgi:Ankyrin repeats (3 copies)
VPAGQLPPNPSLQNLRKRAKALRRAVAAGEVWASEAVEESGVGSASTGAEFSLADAQLVLARGYGFPSWRRLREYLGVVARYSRSPHRGAAGGQVAGLPDQFLRLACLTYGVTEGQDDLRRHMRARRLLIEHPNLARANVYTAAAVGNLAAARDLLAEDATLANRDGGPYRWPPLLYLTYSRVDSPDPAQAPLGTARLLLDHGADPNAGFLSDGEPPPCTALVGALGGGRDPVNQPRHRHGLPLARLLLQAGADANDSRALANVGGTLGDDAHLELLFEFGLGAAARGPWRARLGTVLPGPARLVQDQLRTAAHLGLVNRLALLLRQCAALGVDIDAVGAGPGRGYFRGRTAHELAVLGGHADAARLLANAGAAPPRLDAVEQFAAACLRADRDTVARLLADDSTLVGRCAGHHLPWRAAIMDRSDAINLMAGAGFDLNADDHGTPLHVAAYAGNLAAVKALVQAGADPTVTAGNFVKPGDPAASIDNPTPLGFARYRGHHQVADYLAGLTPA